MCSNIAFRVVKCCKTIADSPSNVNARSCTKYIHRLHTTAAFPIALPAREERMKALNYSVVSIRLRQTHSYTSFVRTWANNTIAQKFDPHLTSGNQWMRIKCSSHAFCNIFMISLSCLISSCNVCRAPPPFCLTILLFNSAYRSARSTDKCINSFIRLTVSVCVCIFRSSLRCSFHIEYHS